MDFQDYEKAALRTVNLDLMPREFTQEQVILLNAALGLTGEAGEFAGIGLEKRTHRLVLGIDGHGARDFDAAGGPGARGRFIRRRGMSWTRVHEANAGDFELALLDLERVGQGRNRTQRPERTERKKLSAVHSRI